MAPGDIYQILDKQTLLGQEVLNVYYYKSDGGSGLQAEDLGDAFIDQMLPDIVAMQSNELVHTEIQVNCVTNLDDFHIHPLVTGNIGEFTQSVNDPFGAYGFELIRSTRATRNGSKRIGGVPDTVVTDGVISSGAITLADTLATTMGGNLIAGGADFTPQIRHKKRTDTEFTYFDAAGAIYKRYTTQNTRKFGRGS